MPTAKAAAYCRFSSDLQRDGFSIEAQLAAIRSYCKNEGIELVREYVDEARSGTNDNRPNFQEMIADSASGAFDCVIVHKLDRFSRDRLDFAIYRKILKQNGCSLRSVTERLDDSPESIILESMLEGMAEYYSRNLARETMKGLRVRASKGLSCSNRPFGYDIVEGRFVKNEADALIVREIFDRVIANESLASIGRDLDSRGIRGARGAHFQYNSLQKIIKNTIYYGDYTYAGEVVAHACADPIINVETWTAANNQLKCHKNAAYARHRVEDYYLTGLLFCGLCGGHFSGHCSHGKSGKVYRRYRCTNMTKGTCNAPVVNKEVLETYVLACIEHDLFNGSIVPELTKQLKARLAERMRGSSVAALRRELDSLKMKESRLLDLYLDAKLDKSVYLSKATEVTSKIKKVELEIKAVAKTKTSINEEIVRAAARFYFESVRAKAKGSESNLSTMIHALVERITLWPDHMVIIYKIKSAQGDSVSSTFSPGALNANYGGLSCRLSAHRPVRSYRPDVFVFAASDSVHYTLLPE